MLDTCWNDCLKLGRNEGIRGIGKSLAVGRNEARMFG